MNKQIYVLGVGHSTPLFIEIAESCGYQIEGLYHFNSEKTGDYDHGYKVLGSFEDLFLSDLSGKFFLLTMGDIGIKEQLLKKIIGKGGHVPTLIHPTAVISRFSKISNTGVVIGALTEIQNDVVINKNVTIWTNVVICHNSEIKENCFIGPKALVGAYIHVERNAFIGQASVLVSGKVDTVGAGSIIGAGSIVTKLVEANVVVAGNPARMIRKISNPNS